MNPDINQKQTTGLNRGRTNALAAGIRLARRSFYAISELEPLCWPPEAALLGSCKAKQWPLLEKQGNSAAAPLPEAMLRPPAPCRR